MFILKLWFIKYLPKKLKWKDNKSISMYLIVWVFTSCAVFYYGI